MNNNKIDKTQAYDLFKKAYVLAYESKVKIKPWDEIFDLWIFL